MCARNLTRMITLKDMADCMLSQGEAKPILQRLYETQLKTLGPLTTTF